MPSEKGKDELSSQLVSDGEADGRSRQWVRDINRAHKVFQQRLPLVTRMSGARRGSKVNRIRSLAQKFLAPALILSTNTRHGCELYLLDVTQKGQLGFVKLTVDHDGGDEILRMNIVLSLHFVARIIQYYRVRDANPLKNQNVRNILAGFRHMQGETLSRKILVHDDQGVCAEICCEVEKIDDHQWLSTATTFIIKDSLYPDRLQAAEEMRQMLVNKDVEDLESDMSPSMDVTSTER